MSSARATNLFQDETAPLSSTISDGPAYRVGWFVIAAAIIVAALMLHVSGMRLVVESFAPLTLITLMLGVAHVVYWRKQTERKLALMTGIFAMLIASSLLAAIISHAGLRLGQPWIDPWLNGIDQAMHIDTPQLALMLAMDFGVGEVLKLFYNSAFPIVFITTLWLSFSGQEERTWELGCCFAVAIIIASCVAVAFPAIGSMVYHKIDDVSSLPNGAGNFHLPTVEYFRESRNPDFDLSRVNGIVTFPSFHMVMALLVPYALRGTRIPYLCAWIWCVMVTLATIAIGGHYVVDLIAGAGLWALTAWMIHPRAGTSGRRVRVGRKAG